MRKMKERHLFNKIKIDREKDREEDEIKRKENIEKKGVRLKEKEKDKKTKRKICFSRHIENRYEGITQPKQCFLTSNAISRTINCFI